MPFCQTHDEKEGFPFMKKPFALLLAFLLFATGCSEASSNLPDESSSPSSSQLSQQPEEESAASSGQQPAVRIGSGRWAESDAVSTLPDEARLLISDYMDRYYEALASLTACDLSPLFSAQGQQNALLNELLLEYLITVRSLRSVDLSLLDYNYLHPHLQPGDGGGGHPVAGDGF